MKERLEKQPKTITIRKSFSSGFLNCDTSPLVGLTFRLAERQDRPNDGYSVSIRDIVKVLKKEHNKNLGTPLAFQYYNLVRSFSNLQLEGPLNKSKEAVIFLKEWCDLN